jgi:rubredoxin
MFASDSMIDGDVVCLRTMCPIQFELDPKEVYVRSIEKPSVHCPWCNGEAKQFEILEEYKRILKARGRYYCDKCGWVEDHDGPIPSLIRKEDGN